MGHTRDTRAHTDTRITQTPPDHPNPPNSNTPARDFATTENRIRGRLNSRSPPAFFARFKDTGGAGILWTIRYISFFGRRYCDSETNFFPRGRVVD